MQVVRGLGRLGVAVLMRLLRRIQRGPHHDRYILATRHVERVLGRKVHRRGWIRKARPREGTVPALPTHGNWTPSLHALVLFWLQQAAAQRRRRRGEEHYIIFYYVMMIAEALTTTSSRKLEVKTLFIIL